MVVSCDADDPAIAELLQECGRELGIDILHVRRAHHGECRLSQVRNNAVRALMSANLTAEARLVFIDGDCCPAGDALLVHERRGRAAALVCAFRIDLTQEQTERFDEAAVRAGAPPAAISAGQWSELRRRHGRYVRQAWMRRLGLGKGHKPKILGANFSVRAGELLGVNGFDEEYVGWGQEDDDFARRIYRSGGRPAIAVRDAVVYHQWHPSRAPGSWDESAGVKRFAMNLPTRCVRGVHNGIDQHPVMTDLYRAGRGVGALTA